MEFSRENVAVGISSAAFMISVCGAWIALRRDRREIEAQQPSLKLRFPNEHLDKFGARHLVLYIKNRAPQMLVFRGVKLRGLCKARFVDRRERLVKRLFPKPPYAIPNDEFEFYFKVVFPGGEPPDMIVLKVWFRSHSRSIRRWRPYLVEFVKRRSD